MHHTHIRPLRRLLVVLAALVLAGSAHAQDAAQTSDDPAFMPPDRLDQLMAQLGDDDFRERLRATRILAGYYRLFTTRLQALIGDSKPAGGQWRKKRPHVRKQALKDWQALCRDGRRCAEKLQQAAKAGDPEVAMRARKILAAGISPAFFTAEIGRAHV